MAEFSTPQTVPNPSLQDVVLMDFSCVDKSKSANRDAPETCPGVFQEAWADQPAFTPTIIQVGQGGNQSGWWKGKRLTPVVNNELKAGMKAGRIAAIGFSEGCSGIKQLLSNAEDSDQIDFVYACDGMHAEVSNVTSTCGPGVVSIPSLEPWIRVALRAAQGNAMMVVTCTEICPYNRKTNGVAMTSESADALVQEVKKRLGYNQIAPRMIPRALIGQSGFAPTPPNGKYWPAWSNDMGRAVKFFPPWAVKRYEILGNLIVVWFKSTTPDDVDQYGNPRPATSLGSAHIWQAWWVMRQVIMEVLACRWAAKCDTAEINTDASASLGATPIQRSTYIDRRFPSVVQRPNPALLHRVGNASLGALGAGCLVEGHFSNLPVSSGSLATALSQYSPTELAIGALGLTVGGIALYKYLTR